MSPLSQIGKGTLMTEKRRKQHTPEQIVKKLCDGDAMLNSDDLNQKQGGEIDHALPGFCFWRNESFESA